MTATTQQPGAAAAGSRRRAAGQGGALRRACRAAALTALLSAALPAAATGREDLVIRPQAKPAAARPPARAALPAKLQVTSPYYRWTRQRAVAAPAGHAPAVSPAMRHTHQPVGQASRP